MKKIITACLLFVSAFIHAQDSTVIYLSNSGLTYDSAVYVINNPKITFEDKFSLILSINIIDTLSEKIFLKFLEEAKREKNETAIMQTYVDISLLKRVKSDMRASMNYIDSASVYENKVTNIRALAKYYYYKGMLLENTGLNLNTVSETFDCYYKAIRYYEQIGGKEMQILAMYSNMFFFYCQVEDFESMDLIIKKINPLPQNATKDYAMSLLNSAYYFLLYKKTEEKVWLDSIIKYSLIGIDIVEKKEPILFTSANNPIFYLHIVEAIIEKSESVINESELFGYIEKAKQNVLLDNVTVLNAIRIVNSKLLHETGRYDEAEREALTCLSYFSDSISNEMYGLGNYEELCEVLKKVYQKKKDYKKALEYEELKKKIEKEKYESIRYNIIKKLEGEYEFEKKEQAIKQLTERQEAQKKITWLYLGIIILLVIVSILSIVWLRSRRKKVEHQVEHLKYRTVRSKFIPHFTGNVLNSISYLIYKNPKAAQQYISDFSEFTSRSLYSSDKLCHALKDELDYAETYLKLEKLRFEDDLNYVINISLEVNLKVEIPTMIVHTFCENALKHGLRNKNGGGKIEINAYDKDGYTVVAVEDDGIGREKAKELKTEGSNEGLKIVDQQIALFNKKNRKDTFLKIIDLYDDDNLPAGTRFELHIPDDYKPYI